MAGETKACPFCGEQILAVAIKCKHCGSDLNGAARSPSEVFGIVMLIVPLIGTALVWMWVGNMNLLQGPRAAMGIILCFVILGTATVAAIEAGQLGMGTRPNLKGKSGSGPVAWFFAVALLWLICFPLYLLDRARWGARNLVVGGVLVALVFGGSAALMTFAVEQKIAELSENPLARALANLRQVQEPRAQEPPTQEPHPGQFGGLASAYDRRSKMVEATMNIRKLADSATAYYEAEHSDRAGTILPFQFPVSVVQTPSKSCCEQGGRCMPNPETWAAEQWAALNFSVDDPFYFQYEFTSSGKGRNAKFTARAVGDLDCNGRRSFFERSGFIQADGSVGISSLKTNE